MRFSPIFWKKQTFRREKTYILEMKKEKHRKTSAASIYWLPRRWRGRPTNTFELEETHMKKNVITIDPAVQKTVNEILENMTLPMSLVTRPQMIEAIRQYWQDEFDHIVTPYDLCFTEEDDNEEYAASRKELTTENFEAAKIITHEFFRFDLDMTIQNNRCCVNAHDVAADYPDENFPDIMDAKALWKRFIELEYAICILSRPNPALDTVKAAMDRSGIHILFASFSQICGSMATSFFRQASVTMDDADRRGIRQELRQRYIGKTAGRLC